MNKVTPYEQLMAAKLDQVPVPDRADSIWSAIEMQLDALAGMPESPSNAPTQTPSNAPTQAPVLPPTQAPIHPPSHPSSSSPAHKVFRMPASSFKKIGWYGLAAAVLMAALLWWYLAGKGHAPKEPAAPKTSPGIHAPAPVGPSLNAPSAPPNEPPTAPPNEPSAAPPHSPNEPPPARPARKDSQTSKAFHGVSKDSLRIDSASSRIPPPTKPDSSFIRTGRSDPPDLDLYETPKPPPSNKKHKGIKGITNEDYLISSRRDSARKDSARKKN